MSIPRVFSACRSNRQTSAPSYRCRTRLAAGRGSLPQTLERHATPRLPSRRPTSPMSRVWPRRPVGEFQRGLNRRDAASRRLACAGPRPTQAIKQSLRQLARDLRRNLSFLPALGHRGPKVFNKPIQLVDVAPEVVGHAPSRTPHFRLIVQTCGFVPTCATYSWAKCRAAASSRDPALHPPGLAWLAR